MADQTEVAEHLRAALRRLAKAVVVITLRHDQSRYAMAATAINELSMEPPSMVVCVNRTASLYTPLSASANFCINILHMSQMDIAQRCSGETKGEQRFEIGDWTENNVFGIPCLVGAQANIICRNDKQIDYGTHGLFIGRVDEVKTSGDIGPLLYVDGRYVGMPHDARR